MTHECTVKLGYNELSYNELGCNDHSFGPI